MPYYNKENPFEMVKFRGREMKYFVVDFGLPRFSEIDAYQIMWNGHYVNYFESSRQYLAAYMNMGTGLFEKYGFQTPIYSYNVQMRNPVTAQEHVRVAVRPMSFRKGMLDLFHVLMANGEVKAVGNIVHAVIEKETRSIPYPIPDVVNEIIGRIFAPFSDDATFSESDRTIEV